VRELVVSNSFEFKLTGLQMAEGTTFDEWLAMGETLKRMDRAVQWWIGDWLNIGEKNYGENYAQAIDVTEAEYQALADYKWVANAIKLSYRNENVGWTVCRQLAAMPEADRADAIKQAATEGWTVREARQYVKAQKALTGTQQNVAPPEGTYSCIVIDPPWPMEKIEREVRPNQVAFDYPVMSEDEILAIKLPAAEDAHLFAWTTQKFLPLAFQCLETWGARYVCTFVWHKPGGYQPVGLPQYNGEFALYARIGTPQFVDTKAFSTVFNAPRGGHSEKPEAFYDMVSRVTTGPRIDMFARREIDGFAPWGNEINE
jgi:N6-adenosine-specific RNA methylase IME4